MKLVTETIAIIAFGAILTFAQADGSVGGLELRIAGVILMLGGILGLLLSLLRTRSRWSQSTARSRQDAIDDRPPPSPAAPPGHDARGHRGSSPPPPGSRQP
ncbi:hypothetical protein GCM10022224_026540 [Nonomuraea antimicrobica]|uniref:PEP-CTERM protein-sorting domain-containing protein n=1 Tax=Nonomuraea antimicrobica TaxID=561173 RepID=A0ABP7BIG8_9ACTN